MGPTTFVIAAQQRFKGLSEAVVPLLTKPARELKRQEAWTLIEYYAMQAELTLLPDNNGKDDRVLLGTSIAGVQFMHAAEKNPGPFGSINAWKDSKFFPTPEFAIVLYRLAVWLKKNWRASTIVWGGIGAGRDATDCHGSGHCVDFYGAGTARAGVFDVGRDWFYRPVYTAEGKLHPRVDNDWWGNDTRTHYRLVNTKDTTPLDESDKLYWNPQAKDFFVDMFQFITNECNHTGDSSPAEIRAGSTIKYGVTMYPDYPDAYNRRGHWDHMHFQLGDARHK